MGLFKLYEKKIWYNVDLIYRTDVILRFIYFFITTKKIKDEQKDVRNAQEQICVQRGQRKQDVHLSDSQKTYQLYIIATFKGI